MSPKIAARTAEPGLGAAYYQRHRPEQTLLYQIIEQHYPVFTEQLAAQSTALPGWHHARHIRATGFHCKIGSPGTQAQSQPDAFPRCVCP